jgi:ribosomal protein S18 acetylase RimI-like enzyme
MPEINIRPAISTDIHALSALGHNFSSDFVWQLDFRQEEAETIITFREVRLPRTAHVSYPKEYKNLEDTWSKNDGLLVAEAKNEPVGYVTLNHSKALKNTWVTDLVVTPDQRRQGIGSALVIASQDWAKQENSRRLVLIMQPKNHPAIQLARKLGFELCGYNDHYFINHDIALFFSKWLR